MADPLLFRDYLPNDIADYIDDELLDWFGASPLATDDPTAAVVECIDTVYSSPHSSLSTLPPASAGRSTSFRKVS